MAKEIERRRPRSLAIFRLVLDELTGRILNNSWPKPVNRVSVGYSLPLGVLRFS